MPLVDLAKRKVYADRYRASHQEQTKKWHKEWSAKNSALKRGYSLKNLYGITLEQYTEISDKQNGKCKICNRLPFGGKKGRNLVVDHDHVTKQIRGLLCQKCNIAIGFLGDDIAGLQRAIDYLNQEKRL